MTPFDGTMLAHIITHANIVAGFALITVPTPFSGVKQLGSAILFKARLIASAGTAITEKA